MAVYAKASGNAQIINGLVVMRPTDAGNQVTYDNTQTTQHLNNLDSLTQVVSLNSRYKYHGGEGGSGNWEH